MTAVALLISPLHLSGRPANYYLCSQAGFGESYAFAVFGHPGGRYSTVAVIVFDPVWAGQPSALSVVRSRSGLHTLSWRYPFLSSYIQEYGSRSNPPSAFISPGAWVGKLKDGRFENLPYGLAESLVCTLIPASP